MSENGNNEIEQRLWDAADELRANSKLKASEYSAPVLGLIFLRYAESKFDAAAKELAGETTSRRRRRIGPEDYHARGVLYLPEGARFENLLKLPESENRGKAIDDAMRAIEEANDGFNDVLPRVYTRLENGTLIELMRLISTISPDADIDTFGQIYEYFLGNFAMAEGQKAGEFYTPGSIVRLIVEVIEPYNGRILDPACGSGGMFVQSAKFVANHQPAVNGSSDGKTRNIISIYGQERIAETRRLCQMNLAVHGMPVEGIREGNTYYEDLHNAVGRFDFVMANPPFNVDRVDKERLEDDPRFPHGMPTVDNANYLWIQLFASALNERGRAGFVMANSASDARGSELAIRQKLIEGGMVDMMIAVSSNFFYTVTLPCTLWFLDRGKAGTERENTVLFIDARQTYRQIDRAHRDFRPDQLEFLANIARLYRGEEPELRNGSDDLMAEHFPDSSYVNVPGLCKVATIEEIEAQGWSLNPGRYVGVAAREPDGFVFAERLEELNEELEILNAEARELEERISENINRLLEVSD